MGESPEMEQSGKTPNVASRFALYGGTIGALLGLAVTVAFATWALLQTPSVEPALAAIAIGMGVVAGGMVGLASGGSAAALYALLGGRVARRRLTIAISVGAGVGASAGWLLVLYPIEYLRRAWMVAAVGLGAALLAVLTSPRIMRAPGPPSTTERR